MELQLRRTPEIEKAWQLRQEQLTKEFEKECGRKPKHLFENPGWLKAKLAYLRITEHGFYFMADYPYENTMRHYVIVPDEADLNESLEHKMWKMLEILLGNHEKFVDGKKYSTYALIKKNEGSINYPHWHLLFYN